MTDDWNERPHTNDGKRCWCKDRMGNLVMHKSNEELDTLNKEQDNA